MKILSCLSSFVCFAIFFGLAASTVSGAGAEPCSNDINHAWAVGERLTYGVKFGFFTAGTSVFSVEAETTVGARQMYKFRSVLTSAPHFFYKLNDQATSFAERNSLYTLRYEKVQRNSSENSTNITVYNHTAGTALRTEDGQARNPITITKFAKDVLSVIYHVRAQNLAIGTNLSIPVHDGMRGYTMEIAIRNRETVTTPAGVFNCLIVDPQLRGEDGKIRKKSQMTLWMTDDHRHIPVRIKIALPIGSLMANLQSMSGVKN